MAGGKMVRLAGLAVLVGVVGFFCAAANDGDVSLVFKGEGKVMSWGFSFDRTVSVSSETLLKGGEDALKAIFKDAEIGGDDSKIEGVSGEFKIEKDGKITGKVKLEWTVSGNPKALSADLTGTATLGDDGKKVVKISFKSENGKVAGSWSHGDGKSMKTSGTGSFTVESKDAAPPKEKEAPPQEGPKSGEK